MSPELIIEKTKVDYSKIAADFTRKRLKLTPDLLKLRQLVTEGDRILDLGCGSGRLVEVFSGLEISYLGVDNCAEFIEIAGLSYGTENYKLIESMTSLPFADNSFDKIFCMATIHHLPGPEMQLKALQEMARVLAKGGKLILTAWDILNNPKIRPLIDQQNHLFENGESEFFWNDCLVPYLDTVSGEQVMRYIHGFKSEELAGLVEKAGFKIENITLNTRGKSFVNQNLEIIASKI